MSSDQMKKMLMLVESCSCEQKQEVEEEQVDELGGKNPDYLSQINYYFGSIYEHGDAGLDYLDKNAPVWTELFNDEKYDGDIERIVNEAPPESVKQAVAELKAVAEELRKGLHEELDLDAFMESIREMVGRQLDEISAKKAFGAAGKRAAQAAVNLAKAPVGAALSTTAAVAAGLSPDLETGEAWLDRSDMARDKTFGVIKKAGKRAVQAVTNLGHGVTKALGEEEVEQTQEDAEFQSFMETLNYVMRKK